MHVQKDLVKWRTMHYTEEEEETLFAQRRGEFVWKPGVLTNALRDGRWLVLEDVDQAPAEVWERNDPRARGSGRFGKFDSTFCII